MSRTARNLFVAGALAALFVGRGNAQTSDPLLRPPVQTLPALPAPAPLPPAPAAAAPLPLAPAVPNAPCGGACNALAGGPPACAPYEDRNGPLLYGDPLLDNAHRFPPGWIADLELPIVAAHLRNNVVGTASFGPVTDTIHLPTAKLDWTVAPRFEVGYRLPEATGDLLVSYRFLTTTGSDTLPNFDPAGNPALLHSRLVLNVIDFDYASHEKSLAPCDMRWWVGVRFADVFFDSTATSATLSKRTSDDSFGVGPHAGLELQRPVGPAGLSLFGRIDGAILFEDIRQHYGERVFGPEGEAILDNHLSHTQPVPFLALQAGVVWRPPQNDRLSVALGYTFERWWEIGELGFVTSRAELTVQGVYLRFGWSY